MALSPTASVDNMTPRGLGDGRPVGYFVDSLFRRDAPAAAPTAGTEGSPIGTDPMARATARDVAEVSQIFMNVSGSEPLPAEDIRYVGQNVAQHAGLSKQDAEKRVVDVYAKAQAKVRGAEPASRVTPLTRSARPRPTALSGCSFHCSSARCSPV